MSRRVRRGEIDGRAPQDVSVKSKSEIPDVLVCLVALELY